MQLPGRAEPGFARLRERIGAPSIDGESDGDAVCDGPRRTLQRQRVCAYGRMLPHGDCDACLCGIHAVQRHLIGRNAARGAAGCAAAGERSVAREAADWR